MMELKKLSLQKMKESYDLLLVDNFPPTELKPWLLINSLYRKGCYHAYGYVDDDGRILGCVFLWEHGRTAILDYLCIEGSCRGGGVGSALMQEMRDLFARYQIVILEVEAELGGDDEDELTRRRRLQFYYRLGYKPIKSQVKVFGVLYDLLIPEFCKAADKEVLDAYSVLYHSVVPALIAKKSLCIPWDPGQNMGSDGSWHW